MELILKRDALSLVTDPEMLSFLQDGECVPSDCGKWIVGTVRRGAVLRYYREAIVAVRRVPNPAPVIDTTPPRPVTAPVRPEKPLQGTTGSFKDILKLQPGQELRIGVAAAPEDGGYGISRARTSEVARQRRVARKTAAQLKAEADNYDGWPAAYCAVAEGYGENLSKMSRQARRKLYRNMADILGEIAENLRKPVTKLSRQEIVIEAKWHKWRNNAPREEILRFIRINGRPPHHYVGVAGFRALKKAERIAAPCKKMTREQQIAADLL